MASVQPVVTTTWQSGIELEAVVAQLVAGDRLAQRRDAGPGAYWFCPVSNACTACATTSGGPSTSGKPWPRFTDCVRTASATSR